MISHPKPGERIVLRYGRKSARLVEKLQGCAGAVVRAGRGPGPRNVEVLLDPPSADIRVVVPRGNVVPEPVACGLQPVACSLKPPA